MVYQYNDQLDNSNTSIHKSYVNAVENSILDFRPEFITNDHKQGKKVLASIEKELENCNEFMISVAFITLSGITPLLQILKDLEEKNISGKILTTDYLMFSEPAALEKLAGLKNIQLKMYCVSSTAGGFHTKGYIFEQNETYSIMIGSSNITLDALTRNKEWNIKLHTDKQGELTAEIINEFNTLWYDTKSFTYKDFGEQYTVQYNKMKKLREAVREYEMDIEQYEIVPNKMQEIFILNLKEMISNKIEKALLISSTGTGKTYAAAFAVKELKPKKVLFLVHREQIARQAMDSFKKIFGEEDTEKTFGLLSGSKKDLEADYLFSTMQMMSKPEIHEEKFSVNDFDIIVIDEVHHAGAESYRRIMEYFRPKFWLGMTASPDTNNYDIYRIFDYNIAYEIRLQQALEEDMICPFHYFGITELEIDGEVFDDNAISDNFSMLISDERVRHVIDRAEYYGYCGNRVKGLVFCSRKDEARELSKRFNTLGYKTDCLTGEDDQQRRVKIIDKLVSNNKNEYLDYIFTVDIFNEGIDIPEVNQVIMLRPTESPVVFVQQLGRGLRKSHNKEYVVILDFIGNYMSNFMIPIALSGDRSYNKDNLRRYIAQGNSIIPGNSTIHFDEITKRRIYESIDVSNFSDIKIIKESYEQLRNKLGRIPKIRDFDEHGEIDVLRIFDNKSLGSYYKFLVRFEDEFNIRISNKASKYLEFICKKFASGKRVHELLLLDILLSKKDNVFRVFEEIINKDYGIEITTKTKNNLINIFTNNFLSGSSKSTYEDCIFIEKDTSDYRVSVSFASELLDSNFFHLVKEIIDFGLYRNSLNYKDRYMKSSFQLYAKYTYEDVCRLLEWEKAEVALNIGGYKYDSTTNTYPVFINYHKEDSIQDTIKYEDRFLNNTRLVAMSKSGRTIKSDDVKYALKAETNRTEMYLFVRRNKDDKTSKEFYYLGRIKTTGKTKQVLMPNTSKNAVEIEYDLMTPVREDIYDYITKE